MRGLDGSITRWKVPHEGIADRCHRLVAGDEDALREMILWACVEMEKIVRDGTTIAYEDKLLLLAHGASD